MLPALPFIFAVPLLPRASARDWSRVQALLDLTLRSALAQTDPNFRILIAGHDRPDALPHDKRVEFVTAQWPTETVGADNPDRGRRAHLLNQVVRKRGGVY